MALLLRQSLWPTRLRFSLHNKQYHPSRVRPILLQALIPRHYLGSLNFLHVLLIIVFIAGNGLATGLTLDAPENLRQRAATLGSINLAPVFIGRRVYANKIFGASKQTYHLIHSCLALVGLIQVTLHAGIAIRTHTLSTVEDCYLFYTGLIGFILLILLILILPLTFLTAVSDRVIQTIHSWLAILSLLMLLWHIGLTFPVGTVVASTSAGLWVTVAFYHRLYPWMYGKGRVHIHSRIDGATIMQIRTKRAMRVYPGCYYYIVPSVWSLTLDTPQILYHWETADLTVANRQGQASSTDRASSLFFLIQDNSSPVKNDTEILLDGPYGFNKHPEKFETVVLVAQGRGIAGVLPVALSIALIGRHDRITRRIDLQWKLDLNDQEEWAEERLQGLINLDPHRSLFAAHLYYPRLRARSLKKLAIPDKHSKQWSTFRSSDDESMNRIRRNIVAKSRYAGHMIVLACGDKDFTQQIQSFVFRLPTLAEFSQIDMPTSNHRRVASRDIRHLGSAAV